MKLKDWLTHASSCLKAEQISSHRLDTLLLLEDATGRDRAWLLAHPEFELKETITKSLDEQIARRAAHEPLAYIRGKSEFYGREFKVTPHTLQPRPETETMIELFLKNYGDVTNVIDVGTGSGAIAVTIKLEKPELEVYATEINKDALDVAKSNTRNLRSAVGLYNGSLIEPVPTAIYSLPTAVLANLPYVPNNFTINKAAMQEPDIAIFGGEDGLDLYRRLFGQISELQHKPILVLTESLPFQHDNLADIAQAHGFIQVVRQNFIQMFKLTLR